MIFFCPVLPQTIVGSAVLNRITENDFNLTAFILIALLGKYMRIKKK